jgi:hypothetical protein
MNINMDHLLHYEVRFMLNALTHMALLWIALLLMFRFVISPSETNHLDQITTSLESVLNKANQESQGVLKQNLSKVPLNKIKKLYNTTDETTTKKSNNDLFLLGVIIELIFIFVILAIVLTIKFGFHLSIGKEYALIFAENLMIFIVIGLSEFAFFKMVSVKYASILPSDILNHIIIDMKQNFKSYKLRT